MRGSDMVGTKLKVCRTKVLKFLSNVSLPMRSFGSILLILCISWGGRGGRGDERSDEGERSKAREKHDVGTVLTYLEGGVVVSPHGMLELHQIEICLDQCRHQEGQTLGGSWSTVSASSGCVDIRR